MNHLPCQLKRKEYLTNKNIKDKAKLWESKFMEIVNKTEYIQEQYDRLEGEFKRLLSSTKTKSTKKSTCINKETTELFKWRKSLYKEKRTKEAKILIAKISKSINRNIKQQKKELRQRTLERFLNSTGAIRKAFRELNNKSEWAVNIGSKEGCVLKRRPDIIKEATRFYKELYANDTTINSFEARYEDCEMHLEPLNIIKCEIEHAIETQKNDKSPGNDGFTNEALKLIGDYLQSSLMIFFNKVIQQELVPKQWSSSSIILLHKKGDRNDLGNYRPISLMTNIYKIFSKILLRRLSGVLDDNQPREQAGFRKTFSTMDHIQVVTQLIEKSNEYNQDLYMCFIDYTKAFDSLCRDYIWRALVEQGINPKYVRLLQNIYSQCSAKIRLEREGTPFPIEKGVRQGDPLSPKLFLAVLESVFRNINWESKGIKINGEFLSHLRFADDIVVFATNARTLGDMVNQLAYESSKIGLSINIEKTKILTNGEACDIIVEGRKIEYVEDYPYLGQLVSFKNYTEQDIKRRIALSWKKYWSLKEIFKNKELDMTVKRKAYDVAILPCLTYGCQTWSLRKEDEEKLAICQRKMERSMLGIKISDRISNENIRKQTKIADVRTRIRLLKWNWAGHICRLQDKDRWTRTVTEWTPWDCKRKQGRPKRRWRDIFNQRVGAEWMRKARDKIEWKKLGEAYAAEATTIANISKV